MKPQSRFTKQEEIANAISHGTGLFLSTIAATLLLVFAIQNNNPWQIISAAIFGTTLIFVYFSSTMTHALNHGRAKDVFHNLDLIAIYLVIAGTYTPIALSVLRGHGGWVMFGIEWGLALTGLLIQAFKPNSFNKSANTFAIISYVVMGWLLLLFLKPLFEHLSLASMILIFSGGFFYSLGILFFKLKKIKFSHLVWHIFVIVGSSCHWVAIFLFIIKS